MIWPDLMIAFRALRRAPAFSIVAVLTLALGIGGTSAVFTLVNSIVLQPLPYEAAERLVVIRHAAPGLGIAEAPLSDATYLYYRSNSQGFEDAGYYYENVVNVTGDGDAERVHIAMVSPSLLTTLGARAARGRLFSSDDLRAGPNDIVPVLISHDLWARRYGSDPGIVGSTIRLNSRARLVIGVLESGFHFPGRETQIWFADELNPARVSMSDFRYATVARLTPGTTPAAAEEDLNALNAQLASAYPDAPSEVLSRAHLTTSVVPLARVVVGDLSNALWLLLGGMAFMLLVACASVANLFLVHSEHRQKETAIRSALGASRSALIRLVLSESMLLGIAAGALGLLVAAIAARLLVAFGPATLPRLHEVSIDGVVLGFTAGLALLTSLGFSAVPALRFRAPQLGALLKQNAFGASASVAQQRVRQLLVITQVAVALTLVAGAALLVQSFWNLRQIEPGFDPDGLLTAEIALPFGPYPDDETSNAFWQRLLDDVRALPGVRTAGAVSSLPLVPVPEYYDFPVAVDGASTIPDAARPIGTVYFVTPGYFETMRIPVEEGELPPNVESRNSAVVSAALARRLFPGADALGRRVRLVGFGDSTWNTIVAVVGDVPERELADRSAEILYLPVTTRSSDSHLTLALRTTLPPATLASAVRSLVRELDPELPLANVRTMRRIVDDSMMRTSFAMVMLLTTGVLALFLGAVGIYGVIAYTVGRRMHEIGVRMALGARSRDVRALVLQRTLRITLIGVAFGIGLALALTRFLRSLLHEVSPTDPFTLAAVAALLLAIGLVAAWLPARRAALAEPLNVLRPD